MDTPNANEILDVKMVVQILREHRRGNIRLDFHIKSSYLKIGNVWAQIDLEYNYGRTGL